MTGWDIAGAVVLALLLSWWLEVPHGMWHRRARLTCRRCQTDRMGDALGGAWRREQARKDAPFRGRR